MKDKRFALVGFIGALLLLAPVSFELKGGVQVTPSFALASIPAADQTTTTTGSGVNESGCAATPAPTTASTSSTNDGVSLTNPGNSVQIGLPLTTGGGNCIANDAASGGAIVAYLRQILQLASGAVGIVILLMMVIAGLQYVTAGGQEGNIKSAKQRLTNAMTALLLFMFMVAILQFIVPGGIL